MIIVLIAGFCSKENSIKKYVKFSSFFFFLVFSTGAIEDNFKLSCFVAFNI